MLESANQVPSTDLGLSEGWGIHLDQLYWAPSGPGLAKRKQKETRDFFKKDQKHEFWQPRIGESTAESWREQLRTGDPYFPLNFSGFPMWWRDISSRGQLLKAHFGAR